VATRFLQIVGWSGTGKTRLVEALATRLPHATFLKWTHHALPAERLRSDTGRIGLQTRLTALLAPEGGLVRGGLTWRDWYGAAAVWAREGGVCLIEGGKRLPVPKVALGSGREVGGWPGVRLVVGPSPPPPQVAWYPQALPLDGPHAQALAEWILQRWEVLTFTLEEIPPE